MATDIPRLVEDLRATFDRGATKPYAWRVTQLEAMQRLLVDNEELLADALAEDLGKHAVESWVTEIGFLGNEIEHLLRHLREWLRPRRVAIPLYLQPARARLVREPLGVVLVIAPWNYPLQLSLAPMAGALAAGNAVVLSPSEHAPATSRALAQLVPAYLDVAAVQVVEGGVPETTALLEQRWDHIFFTGGAAVGRVVLEAAARHLTPVTLELGGKSPTFVDEDADLQIAARRIVWSKFTNAGQTCVAPDYVLASRPVLDELKPLLAKAIRDFHSEDPAASETYGRIINDRHFERITGLIDADRVVAGGHSDAATRYIEPTIVDGVTAEDRVMQEEIFGPVLPLIEVAGVDEAIGFITARDKPLALYVFTGNEETKRRFLTGTSSGAIAFNLPMAHLAVPTLPFGGVGPSGMGSYHGEASLDVFSHTKPVLDAPTRPDLTAVVYPPFTALRRQLIQRIVAPRRRR
ncbi:MAG: aldehyde dehydrogenase family protein [Intrasporangium sp.]|uniref:aldehyde dehydrogenase family protein n=1 Tax=Intrasporangium sp. TaxID=1925024 RepID=UPI003F80A6E1